MRRLSCVVLFVACGCGSSEAAPVAAPAADAPDASIAIADASVSSPPPGEPDAGERDAGSVDAAPPTPPPTLAACATTGNDAFTAEGALCFQLTPIETGEPATGENADVPSIAVRPTAAAPTGLVLFLIGSGGKPVGGLRADPKRNFYAAAAAEGNAVLAVAYSNTKSVGSLCQQSDACFFPTRKSIIVGGQEAGSAATITPDESVVDRATKALRHLAGADPNGGWGGFLAGNALAWPKIVAAGHSQGGGHAAAIGKLFPVARVIQLSATCDRVGDAPATWTNGTAGTWASDPTRFFGFAAPGDTTCPLHVANWENLGMLPARQRDDAAICGNTGDTHSESLKCSENFAAWRRLFR